MNWSADQMWKRALSPAASQDATSPDSARSMMRSTSKVLRTAVLCMAATERGAGRAPVHWLSAWRGAAEGRRILVVNYGPSGHVV